MAIFRQTTFILNLEKFNVKKCTITSVRFARYITEMFKNL